MKIVKVVEFCLVVIVMWALHMAGLKDGWQWYAVIVPFMIVLWGVENLAAWGRYFIKKWTGPQAKQP